MGIMEFTPIIHKDGYAQMPRQAINPYSNLKDISKKDINTKRYIKQTSRFLGEASRNASL